MFLISTRNFPPDVGGIQNLMEGLSNALLSHGPVTVFADDFMNSDNYDQKSNLTIERVGGIKLFRKYRKANLVNECLKKNNIRAIFFDHWKSLEHIDSEHLKKIPNFCLVHSKEINHPKGTLLNKRMNKSFKKSNFVIANSKYTKELAISVGIEEKKIHIINPGTNYPLEILKEYKNKAKDIFKDSFPKIITIARLDKRKSHQNIIMTIRNLKTIYPKIKYVCIGDGEEKNNLLDLKKQLKLNDDIIFFNKIDEKLKTALLNESDLFLMPSIKDKKSVEGFGISFIEAASYGKGSIGGKSGGEADAIENGKTGYLCDGNDLNSIYQNVLKFFEKDNHKTLGLQAKEFSKKFKWKDIVKKYLKLI